jgi:hypothetical protein
MAMSPGDLMSALNIKSRSYFCQLQREGRLRRFLLSRPVSKRYRYSRALLAEYLGEQQAAR